jgi:hypothetical protein
MSFLVGLVGYVGLVALLAWGTTFTASRTARLLGVEFAWFDVPETTSSWRRFVVRLVSSLTPLAASAALMLVSLLAFGTEQPSTRVDVLPGAAAEAGMLDGDRVVRIASQPVRDWDALRNAARQQVGPTPIEIERDGARIVLQVTPRDGRIGVAPAYDRVRPGLAQAAQQALITPLRIQRDTLLAFARLSQGSEKAELRGPVGIVKEVGESNRRGAFLTFLSYLASYGFSFVVCVHAFDAASLWLFKRTHASPAPALRADMQVARLHQALLGALLASYAFVVATLALELGLRLATPLVLLAGLFLPGVYPLIWCSGRAIWGNARVIFLLLACMLVPCALHVLGVWILVRLRQRLRQRGFQLGWWKALPPTSHL